MKLAETELQLQGFSIRHHSPSRDLRKYFTQSIFLQNKVPTVHDVPISEFWSDSIV